MLAHVYKSYEHVLIVHELVHDFGKASKREGRGKRTVVYRTLVCKKQLKLFSDIKTAFQL